MGVSTAWYMHGAVFTGRWLRGGTAWARERICASRPVHPPSERLRRRIAALILSKTSGTWITHSGNPSGLHVPFIIVHMFKTLGNRQLLSQAVEEEIEAAIRSNKLPPGTKLPNELELCRQFGVSRTAVREALRMLSARGLIAIEKGRGTFVLPVTAATVANPLHLYLSMQSGGDSALDLVHARRVIEPLVAELAAVNHDAKSVDKLVDAAERLRTSEGDFEELARLDVAFHQAVAEASGNPLFPVLLEPLQMLMKEVILSVYEAVSDARDSALTLHDEILTAILNRDGAAAREAMSSHLEIAEEHVKRSAVSPGKKKKRSLYVPN